MGFWIRICSLRTEIQKLSDELLSCFCCVCDGLDCDLVGRKLSKFNQIRLIILSYLITKLPSFNPIEQPNRCLDQDNNWVFTNYTQLLPRIRGVIIVLFLAVDFAIVRRSLPTLSESSQFWVHVAYGQTMYTQASGPVLRRRF